MPRALRSPSVGSEFFDGEITDGGQCGCHVHRGDPDNTRSCIDREVPTFVWCDIGASDAKNMSAMIYVCAGQSGQLGAQQIVHHRLTKAGEKQDLVGVQLVHVNTKLSVRHCHGFEGASIGSLAWSCCLMYLPFDRRT